MYVALSASTQGEALSSRLEQASHGAEAEADGERFRAICTKTARASSLLNDSRRVEAFIDMGIKVLDSCENREYRIGCVEHFGVSSAFRYLINQVSKLTKNATGITNPKVKIREPMKLTIPAIFSCGFRAGKVNEGVTSGFFQSIEHRLESSTSAFKTMR